MNEKNLVEAFEMLAIMAAFPIIAFGLVTFDFDAFNGTSVPAHSSPSDDSPEIGRVIDPDCSMIDYGPGRQATDADDNRWYHIDNGWIRAGTWCI